jgi:hypothetical protein
VEKIKTYCQERQVNRVEWLMTIDTLSILYLGLSEPVFQTETYLLNTATGKIHTDTFAAGGIEMSGKQEPLKLSGSRYPVAYDRYNL